MLSVAVKSTDQDLTTTGALKLRLFGSTSDATTPDAVLSAVIRSASRWAEQFVGQPLTVQTYEERVATFGTRRLMLSRTPVRGWRLYESTEDDAYEVTSTMAWADPEAGLIERDEGWPWTVPTELELEERPLPGEESAPWFCRYQAGYAYNGLSTDSTNYSTDGGTTDTGRTLPEDVEEAVLLKCRQVYDQSVAGGEVEEETLADLKTKYRTAGPGVGGDRDETKSWGPAEWLLSGYRRMV